MIKCLYFFDFEARTKISEIFSLVFWIKLIFHKDILKLTDLYRKSGLPAMAAMAAMAAHETNEINPQEFNQDSEKARLQYFLNFLPIHLCAILYTSSNNSIKRYLFYLVLRNS